MSIKKLAALVSERDKAARALDHELVAKLNAQLSELAAKAKTPAERAARRVVSFTGRR